MNRSLVTYATVLSIKPLGENNSSVCLLTRTEGVIYAVLYGGPKSRLKSLVSTWNTGTVYLSFSKNNYKISDFDVKNYHLTFRENIFKSCAASLAAELCMKTHCAGNSERCWALVNGFIAGLDACENHEYAFSGFMRFLWRFLELMGVQPDAGYCAHCGKKLSEGYYSAVDNGFSCRECSGKGGTFYLSDAAFAFLQGISVLSPQEAVNVMLTAEACGQVKSLLYFLLESACGAKLVTLKTAAGIL